LLELRETNNSLLSTKQNETMKTLTVLTFLFLPLSFVAGLFGMNTMNNPIVGNQFDFWIILAIMAFLGMVSLLYFKRKDWL
jgi:magnesium transporter